MTQSNEEFDWNGVDIEVLGRLLDNANGMLQSQFGVSVAADQRSMTFASFMAAIAAGVASTASGTLGLPLYLLAFAVLIFTGATTLAILSAQPIKIHYPSIDPDYLISKRFFQSANAESLAKEIYVKMDMIKENRAPIQKALGLYQEALYMGLTAVVLATVGLIFS